MVGSVTVTTVKPNSIYLLFVSLLFFNDRHLMTSMRNYVTLGFWQVTREVLQWNHIVILVWPPFTESLWALNVDESPNNFTMKLYVDAQVAGKLMWNYHGYLFVTSFQIILFCCDLGTPSQNNYHGDFKMKSLNDCHVIPTRWLNNKITC